jgi:hypothetical protein
LDEQEYEQLMKETTFLIDDEIFDALICAPVIQFQIYTIQMSCVDALCSCLSCQSYAATLEHRVKLACLLLLLLLILSLIIKNSIECKNDSLLRLKRADEELAHRKLYAI